MSSVQAPAGSATLVVLASFLFSRTRRGGDSGQGPEPVLGPALRSRGPHAPQKKFPKVQALRADGFADRSLVCVEILTDPVHFCTKKQSRQASRSARDIVADTSLE